MSKAGLWSIVDGEPFMENPRKLENPRLGILNKRRSKKMAKRGAAHMAWVRSFKQNKRRRRRNPAPRQNSYPMSGAVVEMRNPRKKRKYYSRAKAAVGRYKTRRRAARVGKSTNILGINLPPLETILFTGGGLVGVPMVEGFASQFLPVDLTSSVVGRYALKVGSVLGLTWLTKTLLGDNEAKAVGAGGGAYVLVSALREFAPGMFGMSAYSPMGAYVGGRGLNAYTGMGGRGGISGGLGAAAGAVSQERFNRFGR
jgi:hypothetical protein